MAHVLDHIDGDTDIFRHYFDEADRAEVKRIFGSINNGNQSSDLLNNLLIQTEDPEGLWGDDSRTLAYMGDSETGNPFIVLCPSALIKKAVTALNGKEPDALDEADWYARCRSDGGGIGGNVNYHMNTLGMTLPHEYMHFDNMIASSFGSIIDQPDGYGPVNVYDRLARNRARTNADSYAYYASHVLWSMLCYQETFDAPRPALMVPIPAAATRCASPEEKYLGTMSV